jgi:uncharacterized protein involved in exopolysaccharide biosynthesis
MKTPLLIVLLLVVAGGGFAGGMLFQKSKNTNGSAPAQAESKPQQPPKPKPPGRFHATTKFQVRKSGHPELTSAGAKQPEHDPLWFQSQLGILQTREIMLRAVKNLKLEAAWRMPQWEAVEKFPGMVEITVEPGTDIICVTGYSDHPDEAADFPNAVREAYEEYRLELDEDAFRRVKQGTEDSVEMQGKKVARFKTGMEEMAKKNGITDVVSVSPAGVPPAASTSLDYAAARQEYEKALAMLTVLRDQAARQHLEREVVPRLVETLETATPPDPRTQLAHPPAAR